MEIVLSKIKNNVLPIAKEGLIHFGYMSFALLCAFLGGKGVLEDCFSRPVPGTSDKTVDEQYLGLIFISMYVTLCIKRTIKVSKDVQLLQNTRNKLEGDLFTYNMRFNEVTGYAWRCELSNFIAMIESYIQTIDCKIKELNDTEFFEAVINESCDVIRQSQNTLEDYNTKELAYSEYAEVGMNESTRCDQSENTAIEPKVKELTHEANLEITTLKHYLLIELEVFEEYFIKPIRSSNFIYQKASLAQFMWFLIEKEIFISSFDSLAKRNLAKAFLSHINFKGNMNVKYPYQEFEDVNKDSIVKLNSGRFEKIFESYQSYLNSKK